MTSWEWNVPPHPVESTSCFAMVLWSFDGGDGLCFFLGMRSINARANFLGLSKKLLVEVRLGMGMVGALRRGPMKGRTTIPDPLC
jgi:hypothetical protein